MLSLKIKIRFVVIIISFVIYSLGARLVCDPVYIVGRITLTRLGLVK